MRALVICFLLTACAMSESDCRGIDWYQRGARDGYGGHPPQDLRLAQECRRFGIQVPQADYQKGWLAGYDEWYRLMGSIDLD